MANSAVFNFRRNAGSDWISLTEVGREFQASDAAAGNARSIGPLRSPQGRTRAEKRCQTLRMVRKKFHCPGSWGSIGMLPLLKKMGKA